MDFYLSIDGARKGPYSIFKVGDLLESGEASGETLTWHRGLDEWKPLSDVPALEMWRERSEARSLLAESTASPESPRLTESKLMPPHADELGNSPLPAPVVTPHLTQAGSSGAARPFIRFWARMFDYTAVSVLVFQLSDVVVPQALATDSINDLFSRYMEEMQKPDALIFARTLFLSLVGWHLLEAVLIHLYGTTPGKALFGIKVKTEDGKAVPMKTSVGRSFYVYVMGVGFYQFPLILIGMIFSYFRIQSTGNCLWDQHLKIRVDTPPLGALRISLAIAAFFALLLLQSVKFL